MLLSLPTSVGHWHFNEMRLGRKISPLKNSLKNGEKFSRSKIIHNEGVRNEIKSLHTS